MNAPCRPSARAAILVDMTNSDTRFSGKTALITGGTSGMGFSTARRFLDEGARVVITGRDRGRLDEAVEALDGGDRGLAVRGDSADPNDLDILMARIQKTYGRLDVVFANAGVSSFQPIGDVTEAEFDRVDGINFKGVYFTVQKALPLLVDGGAIIVNASWTLHRGLSGSTLYAATKAAVHGLTRALAAELGPRRIRVNSVSPGYIATAMFHDAVSVEDHEGIVANVSAGRFGSSEDVSGAVAFLASDEASYVNGQDLIIDGGLVSSIAA